MSDLVALFVQWDSCWCLQRSANAFRNGLPSLAAPLKLNAHHRCVTPGRALGRRRGMVSTPRELWIHLVDTQLPVWFVLEFTQRYCQERRATGFTPTSLALAMRFLKSTFVERLTDDGLRKITGHALLKVREGVNDMSLWKCRYPDASDLACKLYSLVTSDLRMADPALDSHIHLAFAEVAGSDDLEEHMIVQLAFWARGSGGFASAAKDDGIRDVSNVDRMGKDEVGNVRPRHRCCECGRKFTEWVCPSCTGLLCQQCWQAHRQRCLCGGLIGDGAGLNRSTLPGEVVGSEASWASSGRACFVEHVFVEHFVAC